MKTYGHKEENMGGVLSVITDYEITVGFSTYSPDGQGFAILFRKDVEALVIQLTDWLLDQQKVIKP